MSQIILGLDPGTQFVGFGVIRRGGGEIEVLGHGTLIPDEPEASVNVRLLDLGQAFREILRRYQPQVVIVEKSFFHKNPDTAFKLGQSRGIFIYEALLAGAQVCEYAARAVKKTVTGQGDADKMMVEKALKNLLPIVSFNSYDASDAMALAYHHEVQLREAELKARFVEGSLSKEK